MAILNNLIVQGSGRILQKLYVNDFTVSGDTSFVNGSFSGTLDVDGNTTLNTVTTTGTAIFSKTTAASGTANNSPALIVGGTVTSAHLELDSNKIIAKSSGTASTSLYLNPNGGAIYLSNTSKIYANNGTFTTNDLVVNNSAGIAYITSPKIVADNINVLDTLRATTYNIDSTTCQGGQIYVSPTIIFSSNTTVAITAISGTTVTAAIIDSNSINTDTIGGVQWTQYSKIKITGSLGNVILGNNGGTCTGTLTAKMNTTAGRINCTFICDQASSLSVKTYAASEIHDLRVMIYEKGVNSSTSYPVGMLLTGYGTNNNSYIDIYQGEDSRTKPRIRLGKLDGLDSSIKVGGVAPTGWGLYGTNVFLTGTIQATAGVMGGWTLSEDRIYHTGNTPSANNTVLAPGGISSTTAIGGSSGTNAWAFTVKNVFGITTAGALYSTSGKIGGWTIGTSDLHNGTTSMSSTTVGLYLGTGGIRNYKDTNTYVNITEGKITAKGVDLTGSITATGGTIGGCSITNGVLSVPAANISGTLSANQIDASSITIGQSQVTNLSTDLSTLSSNVNKVTAQYGTCSTTASTQAKVVTCSGFVLYAGALITVKFSTANTYATNAVQLNVNSTGAKNIFVGNAATSSTNQLLWGANASITFRYDGTQFILVGEPRTWYGACSTAAGTAAKTDTTACTGCVICKGTVVSLSMTNNNTATSPTLNIQSTGAKTLYAGDSTTRPLESNGLSWTSGSTTNFVFDGQYWRVGDTAALSRIGDAGKTATNFITTVTDAGIKVHDAGNTTDYIQIKSDGTYIYKGNNLVSSFGTDITLGQTSGTNRNIYIDSDSGVSIRKGSTTLANYGDTVTLYHGVSGNKALTLDSTNGLQFYKLDGSTVAAQLNANGLVLNNGYIGGTSGWNITSKKLYNGTIGSDSSMFLGTADLGSATVAGQTLSTWRMTVGSNFGVTNTGAVYASAGYIGGCEIVDGVLQVSTANIDGVLTADKIQIPTYDANLVDVSENKTETYNKSISSAWTNTTINSEAYIVPSNTGVIYLSDYKPRGFHKGTTLHIDFDDLGTNTTTSTITCYFRIYYYNVKGTSLEYESYTISLKRNASTGAIVHQSFTKELTSEYADSSLYYRLALYCTSTYFKTTGFKNIVVNYKISDALAEIGGWSISSDRLWYLSNTPSSSSMILSPNGVSSTASIGGSDTSSKTWTLTIKDKFGVTTDGTLYCSGANISGEINATSGTIGGAEIIDGVLTVSSINITDEGSENLFINTKAPNISDPDLLPKFKNQTSPNYFYSSGQGELIDANHGIGFKRKSSGTSNIYFQMGTTSSLESGVLATLIPGNTYIFSCDLEGKTTGDLATITLRIDFGYSNGSKTIRNKDGKYSGKVEYVFSVPSQAQYASLRLQADLPSINDYILFKNMMLEKKNGSISKPPSLWSPSPDDISAYVIVNNKGVTIPYISSTISLGFNQMDDHRGVQSLIKGDYYGIFIGDKSNSYTTSYVYFHSQYGVCPYDDNLMPCGRSNNRWSAVYAANGTIQTSDEREKEYIYMYNKYSNLFMSLKPIEFTWKNDSDKRLHLGIGAQTLEKSMKELDYDNMYMLQYDEESDRYSAVYTELQMLTIPVVQDHEYRIRALEEENEKLRETIKLLTNGEA